MSTLQDETSYAAAVADLRLATGRWPSPGSPNPRERELGLWLQEQRGRHAAGELDVFRRSFLDVSLPGWRVDADERWIAGARDLVDFIIISGRFPDMESADLREQGIAAWLRMQQSVAEHGSLRPDRREWLNAHCHGWCERTGRASGPAAHIGS